MAAPQIILVLWTLLAFQVKHLICDFVIQTRFQVTHKGFYADIGGITHAGCHAVFSIPVLLLLTRAPQLVAIAVTAEFVVHYHTDWLKARTERVRGWTQQDHIYWVAFGVDQFIHQVTYIAMTAWVLRQSI